MLGNKTNRLKLNKPVSTKSLLCSGCSVSMSTPEPSQQLVRLVSQAAAALRAGDVHQRHVLVQAVHHGPRLGHQVQPGLQSLLVLQRSHRQGVPRAQPQTHRHCSRCESQPFSENHQRTDFVVVSIKNNKKSSIYRINKTYMWFWKVLFPFSGRPLSHQPPPDAH